MSTDPKNFTFKNPMPIHRYVGQSALSTFKKEKQLQLIKAVFPSITDFQTFYVYLLENEDEALCSESYTKITTLLQAEAWDAFSFGHADPEYQYSEEAQYLNINLNVPSSSSDQLLVLPRTGTISPWSSKATDIFHNTGLQTVSRVERGVVYSFKPDDLTSVDKTTLSDLLHDRMTESVFWELSLGNSIFTHDEPALASVIDILAHGKKALKYANETLGLALSGTEISYLLKAFKELKRNPTDTELMMFAQMNSEHCRHKIFNARWTQNGKSKDYSLFDMIRNTYYPDNDIYSAYEDNAAVLKGTESKRFWAHPETGTYGYHSEMTSIVIKVETHNHPTGISPFSGAATGSGGEIRDEAATGRGGIPKAGLSGFSVSNLQIPGYTHPWEAPYGKPKNIASPLDIMLEAPIGAAAFNNEFGRPCIAGYFRTYEMPMAGNPTERWGYHKPIMIAGGLGNIRSALVKKQSLPVHAKIIVLGGPALLIGMGGAAASSLTSGSQEAALDFASVQRGNPEMQRRCQEVINTCWTMGENNPILSIHDVGAGGLSNAIPELLHGSHRGGTLELRAIPSDEAGLSPMEIWCNEAQERYVLAIPEERLARFSEIAERERCPFAVLGFVTEEKKLILEDKHFENTPIDMPMEVLLGKLPKETRKLPTKSKAVSKLKSFDLHLSLTDIAERILQLPCVADKSFLITIGDRTVTGMIARDPMIGPWQVPVSDVAVTANGFKSYKGEAMAIGERPGIAVLNPAASARMAVGEAITNIAAACIENTSAIKLSANWMAAANYPGEAWALYEAVEAIGMDFCPALGITIPVGKDSLSMQSIWQENGKSHSVTSPLSVVISAFAPVQDIRKTLTPELERNEESYLYLIDLGQGRNRLGGSAFTQVCQISEGIPADIEDPSLLERFFDAIQLLRSNNALYAYHDRSDGGLFVSLCEMAFASHTGLTIDLTNRESNSEGVTGMLFSEELGAVIQIPASKHERVKACLAEYGLMHCAHKIGVLNHEDQLIFRCDGDVVLQADRIHLQKLWSQTSYQIQLLRDNPKCIQQAFDHISDRSDPGLNVHLSFDLNEDITAPFIHVDVKPKVAILREQGVNGHIEMAAAFDRAGFKTVDVHMTDILSGRVQLDQFTGLAAGGGFSYGDVLGAGRGWAHSILNNSRAYDEFSAFFNRSNTFTFGACNGCQMLSQLTSLIPGTQHWPVFLRNESEQFEARLSLVTIQPSPSIFFKGMEGSQFCMPVAHGEGKAVFKQQRDAEMILKAGLVSVCYVDHLGKQTEQYPNNPNGSPLGITGLTSLDGRATILMPHPERVFRTIQNSWHPKEWKEDAPTMRMFRNARVWVG